MFTHLHVRVQGVGNGPHGTTFFLFLHFNPLIGTRLSMCSIIKLEWRQHIIAFKRGSERGHSNLRFHILNYIGLRIARTLNQQKLKGK